MNSNKKILAKVKDFEKYSGYDMTELKAMLEENIREEAVKGCKRNKSELSIVKSLFKDSFYKTNGKSMKDKTFMDKEFYVYMTMHRVFYTRTDLGYEVMDGKPFNVNFLDEYASGRIDVQCDYVEFEIDLVELQTFIDTHDKNDRTPFIIKITHNGKNYLLGLNARYLMDSIKFTNNSIIRVYLKTNMSGNCIVAPIYNAEIDDEKLLQKLVVTLPVNVNGETEEEKFNQVVVA